MAQVTVRINGYAYTLGCQDGEEADHRRPEQRGAHAGDGLAADGG
jgi:hypothetical protein